VKIRASLRTLGGKKYILRNYSSCTTTDVVCYAHGWDELKQITEAPLNNKGYTEFIKPTDIANTPVISVVMSVYNGQKYLRESIESILVQTYKDFEFIIINDGSSDSSRDIISSYDDPRIRLIDNEKNMGLTWSLNRAIELSRCEYIARQDADDISVAERLEKQLNYMENHPQVAVVGCFGNVFNTDGIVGAAGDLRLSGKIMKRHLAKKNLLMHGSVMMRKSHLAKVGCYREFFRHSQDYDLWLRLSEHFDLAILPEFLYQYRITADAISVSRSPVQKEYADIARQLHAERLTRGGDSYDSFLRSYPEGLPVRDEAAGKYEYYLYLARVSVSSNKLKQAREELWQAWRMGCRRPEIFYLFLKTLLGARLLNILRELKNFSF
jgi:glycosyltransferase involved in cell wall biosynthesis